jgi:radical SAM protein with 4Fe4S-binding SPASM domain
LLYRQKQKTSIRIFNDARNSCDYGYIANIKTGNDRAFDSSGAVFLQALSRKAQSLHDLAAKVSSYFADVDTASIENDVREFYDSLARDGFLVSGETALELETKDPPFSYSHITEKTDHIPGERKSGKSGLMLVSERFGGKPHLYELRVELSNRCNERCVHCYIPMNERVVSSDCDIDTHLFKNVLFQCKEAGLVRLALTGGEPMLHRSFTDFLETAIEYDFFVEIFSNLTLLTDGIIEKLKSSNISAVRVSLYSMNAAVHDSITGIQGSFAKTFRNIERLVKENIPVQIGCMVMKQNKDSFLKVKEWGDRNNVPVINDYFLYAPFDHSGANLGSRLSFDELEEVMKSTLADDTDYLIDLIYMDSPVKPKQHDERVCGICTFSFSLSATGDVYPCAGWQNYVLGNVKSEKLVSIIEDSTHVKFLRNIRRKDLKRCFTCEHIDYCRGCLMRNAVESPTGDMFEINEYFCKAASIKHRLVNEKIKEQKCCIAKKVIHL